MTRGARRRQRRARQRAIVLGLLVVALVGGMLALFLGTTTAPTSTTTTTVSTTTTTTAQTAATAPPPIPATPGWGVIARTGRGVAVDQHWFTDARGARIFVLRFRKGATAFHIHVGSEDPPGANGAVPLDAQAQISPFEWRVGVLGVFNGGFKQAANAGGFAVDNFVAASLHAGAPTAVIDTAGQLTIGSWGVDEPKPGHPVIAARQNLSYLIFGGRISPYANEISPWGVTLGGVSAVARTGVAVDAAGDVLYAVGSPLLPMDLAQGLAAAGAVRAMEMDINPYWPISGASPTPLHAAAAFKFLNPYSQHDPSIYATGWLRDFFVVMAEPTSASCAVRSPAPVPHHVTPAPPRLACAPRG